MANKGNIRRIAIVDFERAEQNLDFALAAGSPDMSIFTDAAPPTKEDQIKHAKRVSRNRQKLEDIKKSSASFPYRFHSESDIPRGLVDRSSITYKHDGQYWLFRERIYLASGAYTEDEFKLLVFQEAEREQKEFSSLASKYQNHDISDTKDSPHTKRKVTSAVRREVWRRDQGICVSCGSRERLEFDHIIPVSEGGSNTARNIELLCEACNRSKGSRIT